MSEPPLAPITSCLEQSWHGLGGLFPNKVFVWDVNGIYVDCLFPNPLYGHFCGGEAIKGKQIYEVLPADIANVVHGKIKQALNDRILSDVWIELSEGQVTHPVYIRFIPGTEYVIGLIHDHPESKGQAARIELARFQQVQAERQIMSLLSFHEQMIAKEVVGGLSNKAIAHRLGIKEPTVKFHLTNIYKKLNLKSRVQLALYAPIYFKNGTDTSPL